MLKNIVTAISMTALAASTGYAGTMEKPKDEPVVQMAHQTDGESSSGGMLVPLLVLLVIAAMVAADDDEEPSELSDIRVKRDVVRVGTAPNGLPLYHFKYLWSDQTYQGVMAQDVLSHTPEAVQHKAFGLMKVNYGMLGLDMTKVD